MPAEVQAYLLKHGNRGLAGMLGIVERLQRAAFTATRRVTVPLAREILKQR